MNRRLKIKDILLLALLTAIYMIIYMVCMAIISPLGAYGHAISPGICGIFSGTVIYFMSRKVGKMWQFTIFTLLVRCICPNGRRLPSLAYNICIYGTCC